MGQPVHCVGIRQSEQRTGVTGREDSGGDASGDRRREFEQAQGVGDLGAGASDPGGQFLLGAAEVVEQLLVCRCLLQGVELAAVKVLEEGVPKQVVVLGGLDDGWDGFLARRSRGAPAPLSHDEFVSDAGLGIRVGRQGAHHNRLEDTDLPDRVHQLAHVVLVEDRARLARVGTDGVEGKLAKGGSRHGGKVGATCGACGRIGRIASGDGFCGVPAQP